MSLSFEGLISLNAGLLKGGDRKAWEQAVLFNLQQISASRSGRCLRNQIRRSPRQVRIVPLFMAVENADSSPDYPQSAYYWGRPVRSGADGQVAKGDHRFGTGSGSDVRVHFTPWRLPTVFEAPILLHELEHAAEQAKGVLFSNALGWRFDTVAEFDAILVENIYRSEMGLASRKNHWGFGPRTSNQMIPQLDALRRLVDSFRTRMPQLAAALA